MNNYIKITQKELKEFSKVKDFYAQICEEFSEIYGIMQPSDLQPCNVRLYKQGGGFRVYKFFFEWPDNSRGFLESFSILTPNEI